MHKMLWIDHFVFVITIIVCLLRTVLYTSLRRFCSATEHFHVLFTREVGSYRLYFCI